jgi:hypothetical protein
VQLTLPPFRREEGPAVPLGPLPAFEASEEYVSLGLPGLGTIQISVDEIVLRAPDDAIAEATQARLGAWGEGQWFALQGCLVVQGATVARSGRAVAIVGPSRAGSSVTAIQLTRLGFGLVSDGYTVVAEGGAVMARKPVASVDSIIAERLFPDLPREPRPSGRARASVTAPGHTDAELVACAVLNVRSGHDEILVHSIGGDRILGCRMRPFLRGVPGTGPILTESVEHLPTWSFTRKNPESMDDFLRIGPPSVATAIAEAVAELM